MPSSTTTIEEEKKLSQPTAKNAGSKVTKWSPPGTLYLPTGTSVEDLCIVAAGVTPLCLKARWEERKALGTPIEPETINAMIEGCQAGLRKCNVIVSSIVEDLVSLEALTDTHYNHLAALCCDLGNGEAAKALLARTRGQKRSLMFYYTLLRLATMCLREVDIEMAIQINDDMTQWGIPQTPSSLRFMMHGFSRMEQTPWEALFNTMSFRMSGGDAVEPCSSHQFLSIVETVTAVADVERAIDFLRAMNQPILKDVIVEAVGEFQEWDSNEPSGPLIYHIVDPFSAEIDELKGVSIPAGHHIVFLFSTLRALCEKKLYCACDHPFAERVASIRKLMIEHPDVCHVMPLIDELQIRACDCGGKIRAPTITVENTPHSKLLCFLHRCQPCRLDEEEDFKVTLVATDPALAERAEPLVDAVISKVSEITTIPLPTPRSGEETK